MRFKKRRPARKPRKPPHSGPGMHGVGVPAKPKPPLDSLVAGIARRVDSVI